MKRHHIVGIIAGICGIGFTVRSALSGNIIDALIDFTVFSVVAVQLFLRTNYLRDGPTGYYRFGCALL